MDNRLKAMAPYAALLGGAAYLFYNAGHFAYSPRPGELGPDFWPKAVLVLLMLVCGWEVVARLVKREAIAERTREEPGSEAPRRFAHLLVLGIALSVGYVLVLPEMGFFISTAAYLALFMLIGRYRRYLVIGATSVLGSLVFVFVFMRIVYVSLPLGVGPFQQVSVWLLALLGIR